MKNMWKNFRKAIYSIILTGVLSLIFVFGGCVNTKDGKPRIYIEVKNPLTGEWVSQTETYGGNISCKWEYGREMPEKLECRFKQGKKYIELEDWKGENLTGTGEAKVYGSIFIPTELGFHALYVDVNVDFQKYDLVSRFNIYISIFGKAELGDNEVLIEEELGHLHTSLSGTFISETKWFQFTAPETGTYRFETVDQNLIRPKRLDVNIPRDEWVSDNYPSEKTGTGEDRFLELTLQQGQYCDIYTEITDAFYIDGDSSYILRITKAEEL
jgi:lipoprotein